MVLVFLFLFFSYIYFCTLCTISQLESGLADARQRATFLAASAPHSGDWLAAFPIAACGLCLDDEAVRAAVALRLGLKVCVPHTCPCGQSVDAWGLL